jgi:hypothetical protein
MIRADDFERGWSACSWLSNRAHFQDDARPGAAATGVRSAKSLAFYFFFLDREMGLMHAHPILFPLTFGLRQRPRTAARKLERHGPTLTTRKTTPTPGLPMYAAPSDLPIAWCAFLGIVD